MRRLVFWLIPIALFGGQARYARLGDFDGDVDVQLHAADEWQPALRNMPVGELAWLRTGQSSRAELELDEGSALRLGPNSLVELSDYTRLSTGQRITLISLDHGLAYFTGIADGNDALLLAVPGAQVTVRQGARLRLEGRQQWSQIAAIEGSVRYSSPTAEFDLREGEMARLDPGNASRFYLYREITPLETDRWSEERDKVLASSSSGAHVPLLLYGRADLDANGVWIQSGDLGAVWKPRVASAWAPFREGKWQWYDGLGYTWISADSWGWLPYHYGRWMQQEGTGWVWAPGSGAVFEPGEVYWLQGAKLAGWGALGPGEEWKPPAVPRQFLNANTTYAQFAPDAHVIDPAGFTQRPKEALVAAAFVLALPSPAMPAARLQAVRPALLVGSTRVVPVIGGVTFDGPPELPAAEPESRPPAADAPPAGPEAEQPVTIVDTPPAAEPPAPVAYPVPVYTGIIVVAAPSRTIPVATVSGTTGKAGAPPPPKEPPPVKPPHEVPRPRPADGDKPGK